MKPVWTALVVGLKELEAGKTTVAQALLYCLQDLGVNACGFKPKAGNTLWYDYDVVYESLSQGRLYGKDSKLLKVASNTDLPEEVITPIHRLWSIPPLKPSMAVLPPFIMDRIIFWEENPQEMVVVNDTLSSSHGRESLVEKIYKPETEVLHVTNLKELNEIIRGCYDRAVKLAYNSIMKKHEAVVCESYADIALPWKELKDLDLVLTVQPGCIKIYPPDKYLSAVNLSAHRQREQRTQDVVDLLKPTTTLKILPHKTEETVSKLQKKLRPLINETSIITR
ncbi:MAG: hypothetical protein ACOC6H_04315 [Thermoproteota archaeon]